MVSEWQKSYEEEARELIKKAQEEYKEMVRMSNIVASKLCEVGSHTTDSTLRFCKYCKRSFCAKHGDIKKAICDECAELRIF